MKARLLHFVGLSLLWIASISLHAKIPLRVALYPYIPDSYNDRYAAFQSRIEQDFEARFPEVDLQLRPLSRPANFYNYDQLRDLLNTHDIVEVDSIFLGHLMKDPGLLAPWPGKPCEDNDWQAMPYEACMQGESEVDGEYYAYPHWQCAYFLFGDPNKLSHIQNLDGFIAALNKSLRAGTPMPLAFILSGSHTISEIYMDAWSDATTDTIPWESFPYNSTSSLDALKALANISSYACTPNGQNPALDGFFEEHPALPEKSYDAGFSDFYIGYSEDYYYILAEHQNATSAKNITAIHAPWGAYNHPNIAVDVFLLSQSIDSKRAYYAQKFVEYMTAPQTFEWIVLSKDVPESPAIPRYLLPSTYSAFNETSISQNPMMQRYASVLASNGTSLLPTQLYSELVYAIANTISIFLQKNTNCK